MYESDDEVVWKRVEVAGEPKAEDVDGDPKAPDAARAFAAEACDLNFLLMLRFGINDQRVNPLSRGCDFLFVMSIE
jgi:hypothetical protein